MVILLMLGLLMFLSGPAPASTPPAALVPVDYLRWTTSPPPPSPASRLAMDLLAGALPPLLLLLLWLLSNSEQSWQGVERCVLSPGEGYSVSSGIPGARRVS